MHMDMDRIWNGWRATHIGKSNAGEYRLADTRSVFTQILASGLPDEQTYIVHRGKTCFAIMNAFPYTSGHVLVLPYREIPDLSDLTVEETGELWGTVTAVVAGVRAALKPQSLNIGINLGHSAGGSIPQHLHVHVVPRWTGDTNFMTAIAETRLLPEPLDVTAAKIRSAIAAIEDRRT